MTHLKEEYFNRIWKTVSGLYQTQETIRAFMTKASFQWQEVELLGTGENMVYSLISVAEKKGRVKDIVETALRPDEYADNTTLQKLLADLTDRSAYMPDMNPAILPVLPSADRVNVMLVYDQQDEKITRALYKQLYPLEKFAGSIRIFDMHLGITGDVNREKIIGEELDKAQIVLLLLTPHFMGNSGNGCADLGFNAFQKKKRVIPVLLKDCMWDRIKFLENIMPLPRNEKFVSNWENEDEALLEIANGVEEVVEAMKTN